MLQEELATAWVNSTLSWSSLMGIIVLLPVGFHEARLLTICSIFLLQHVKAFKSACFASEEAISMEAVERDSWASNFRTVAIRVIQDPGSVQDTLLLHVLVATDDIACSRSVAASMDRHMSLTSDGRCMSRIKASSVEVLPDINSQRCVVR